MSSDDRETSALPAVTVEPAGTAATPVAESDLLAVSAHELAGARRAGDACGGPALSAAAHPRVHPFVVAGKRGGSPEDVLLLHHFRQAAERSGVGRVQRDGGGTGAPRGRIPVPSPRPPQPARRTRRAGASASIAEATEDREELFRTTFKRPSALLFKIPTPYGATIPPRPPIGKISAY